jgi:hypothetical protein
MELSHYQKEQLKFRRQFILSRDKIAELERCQNIIINGSFYLYVHPDLNLSIAKSGGKNIILLGYILDYQNHLKSNQDIIEEIIKNVSSFESLTKAIKNYAGQYVIIFYDDINFIIFHDPLGLREIYYCVVPNKIICGSQPNIIVNYSEPEISPTNDKKKINFYKNDMPKVRAGRLWVGDETYYDEINHLLPNHYLDINKMQSFRYWPNEKIKRRELGEVVDIASNFLSGILKAAYNRYELMMAVTAGNDTRTLLAASRDLSDKIYYFINKHIYMDDNHPDIKIPSAIFNKLNIPFHIHVADSSVPESFKKIFFSNVFFASEQYLPVIYNVYYKFHSTKLNVLGVGEIGRNFFGTPPRKINGYFLARALKYKNSLYAVEKLQRWLDEAKHFSDLYNVDIMTLLLWEQLLGNWGVVADSESDIAIEHFDPFNSHYLYEILLSVDKKIASKKLFREIIKKLWPELLEFPINPPRNIYLYIRNQLKKIGVFELIRNAIYRFDEIRFKLKSKKN